MNDSIREKLARLEEEVAGLFDGVRRLRESPVKSNILGRVLQLAISLDAARPKLAVPRTYPKRTKA